MITKFVKKKIGEFGFGQIVQNLPKNYEQALFYETYFKESKIDGKPLIWSKYYFTKLTSKRVK